MNPKDLFDCSSLLVSLNRNVSNSAPKVERIVFWPPEKGKLMEVVNQTELAHEADSMLVDSQCDPRVARQTQILLDNGLLAEDSIGRVMTITVKLKEQISSLHDDLSINREVIHSLEDFKSIRHTWDQFEVDPMNSFAWNLSWWKAFQTHGDLHLMKFERAGKIVGIAPLYLDRWYGLKRLRFLATGEACTDYADIICEPDHYDLCSWSLGEYIREQRFDVVELESTRDDRLAVTLKDNLSQTYRFDHRIVEPTWRIELPESWETFVGGVKKSLRRKINKASRNLASDDFSIESTLTDLPLEEAFETFKSLHTRRMNSTGKPGIFADPQFEQFIESAVVEFSTEDRCEIVVVSHLKKPIAVQLYFKSAEGFQLYNSGYAPDAMKLEPGHLMFTAMIQRAISRGDTCFDFLRGNEPYKEFWGALPHSQMKLRMVAKRAIPIAISTVVVATRAIVRGA